MSHLHENKKIISRIHRIKGQLEAIEKSLNEDTDCFQVLQNFAACKGAMNGLMNELIADHITEHIMVDPNNVETSQDKAAADLIQLLKTYWK